MENNSNGGDGWSTTVVGEIGTILQYYSSGEMGGVVLQ